MTEQPPHVFRNKLGDYSWLPEDRDAVCDGACEILERMQGYTDRRLAWKSRSILVSYARKAKDE